MKELHDDKDINERKKNIWKTIENEQQEEK